MTVSVKNTGRRKGTEIVQVYVRRPADTEGSVKSLRGYARVTLEPGEQQQVEISMPRERFEVWDSETNTMRVVPGKYDVMVGASSANADLQTLHVNLN